MKKAPRDQNTLSLSSFHTCLPVLFVSRTHKLPLRLNMKPAHRGENCKSFECPLEANSQRIHSLYLFYLTFISTFTRETRFRQYNEITIKESNNKIAFGRQLHIYLYITFH